MELLGWRSVKDISGDGGVIKTTTKEGSDWQKPSDRDEVLGEYLDTLLNLHSALYVCMAIACAPLWKCSALSLLTVCNVA